MTERIKELTSIKEIQAETGNFQSVVETGEPQRTTEIEDILGLEVAVVKIKDGKAINLKRIEEVRERTVLIDSSSAGETVEVDGELVVTDHGTFDKKLNVFSDN